MLHRPHTRPDQPQRSGLRQTRIDQVGGIVRRKVDEWAKEVDETLTAALAAGVPALGEGRQGWSDW
jgi:hypothetical protein